MRRAAYGCAVEVGAGALAVSDVDSWVGAACAVDVGSVVGWLAGSWVGFWGWSGAAAACVMPALESVVVPVVAFVSAELVELVELVGSVGSVGVDVFGGSGSAFGGT